MGECVCCEGAYLLCLYGHGIPPSTTNRPHKGHSTGLVVLHNPSAFVEHRPPLRQHSLVKAKQSRLTVVIPGSGRACAGGKGVRA